MTRSRLLFAACVLLQLLVLYWPKAVSTPHDLPWDKLAHALIFGLVAWSGVRAGVPVGWLVAVLIGHAVLSEVIQDRLLPNRSGDPWDAVADTIGTLLGVIAAGSPSRQDMMRGMWGGGR